MQKVQEQSSRLAAIERLLYRKSYAKASLYAQRALTHPGKFTKRDLLQLELIRAHCLAFMGDYCESKAICARLMPGLRVSADHGLYARCCYTVSVINFFTGELDTATEYANLAHYTFKRADLVYWTVSSINWLGGIQFYKGDYSQALECFAKCSSLASGQKGLERWRDLAKENQSRVYMLLGLATEATISICGIRRRHIIRGEAVSVFRHDLSLAYLCILKRQHSRAARCLSAYEEPVRSEFPVREQGIWHEYFGELELSRGNLDEATKHLKTAIGIGEGSGPDLPLIGQSRRLLAQTHLASGDLTAAEAECERAYEAIRTVGERIEEGICDRIMGEIHEQRGEHTEARACFESSTRMLRLIGARVELGRTLLAAARQTTIDQRARMGYLLEAERVFTDSGIAYWVDQVHAALHGVLKTQEQGHTVSRVVERSGDTPEFITRSAEIRETLELAETWAASELAVLITGETGTGKDLLAQIIHKSSPRHEKPFVDIDLSTLPDSIWESELFGHKKGSFTGATTDKVGLLESADGGTVFFNEIGNLSLALQAKLLEFLDSHEIRRVGDTRRTKLDLRLIAATNSELRDAVEEGLFRSDLYYRLNQAHLHLIPLRERTQDIPVLIRHYLLASGATEDAVGTLNGQPWMKRAMSQRWIGNVRQLSAFVGRMASTADLHDPSTWDQWAEFLLNYNERIERNDLRRDEEFKARVLKVLDDNGWNQRASARTLSMSESGLRRQLRRWGIARPND